MAFAPLPSRQRLGSSPQYQPTNECRTQEGWQDTQSVRFSISSEQVPIRAVPGLPETEFLERVGARQEQRGARTSGADGVREQARAQSQWATILATEQEDRLYAGGTEDVGSVIRDQHRAAQRPDKR